MTHYQTVIVGGGPGGYETAIRLNQYGISTAVFEKERLGGVCLNWGCIPTKSLVKVAELYTEIKEAESFGLRVENHAVDYARVFERKNAIVEKLVSGIEYLFEKQHIPVMKETVTHIQKHVNGYAIRTAEGTTVTAEQIVLATGSVPRELPGVSFDGESIYSSQDILAMEELPKKLAVIGGGVIGCEFASIYAQLGVEVEIIEFLPRLLFAEDEEVSKRLTMAFKKAKITVQTKTSVDSIRKDNNQVILTLSNGKEVTADKVLVSVGRVPVCDIMFEDEPLLLDNGKIVINDKMETNLPGIFAIGDATGKLQLAHTASKQGLMVAAILQARFKQVSEPNHQLDYLSIPRCTFTNPEVASVGLTEEQAKEQYGEVLVGRFPFSASGKAMGMGNTFGFVKTIAEKESGKLIGMHIIGPVASELIAQGGILLGTAADKEVIEHVVFAHPTLSEAVMESIEDLSGLSIHKI